MPAVDTWLWIVLVVVNAPVYWLVGWALFNSWAGFFEALKYVLTPDGWSLLKGEWFDDQWETLKVFLWLACCAGAVYGEAHLVEYLFGSPGGP